MGKVIEFPNLTDTLKYVRDDGGGRIVGVVDSVGVEITNCDDENGFIAVDSGIQWMKKEKIKELMIAWLSLNYPDVC